MPSCKIKKWNNTRIQILPSEADFIRGVIRWIPYFWDSDINLDVFVSFPLRKGFNPLQRSVVPSDKWTYKWKVCTLDNRVVRQGYESLTFDNKLSLKGFMRKLHAITLDNLGIGGYKIYAVFSDTKGVSSEDLFFTSFTVRDREEYMSTYILPAIISILVSFIVSLLLSGKG